MTDVRDFVQVWFTGLFNPIRAFYKLKSKPAPLWGLLAVLIRFIGTSLTTIQVLFLLRRMPFVASNLTFLAIESYYSAEIIFLPIFGITIWLLMSAVVYVVLRLIGKVSNFDQILNIVGMGMLTPMPAVWLWDWVMIALNSYQLMTMAVSHAIFQLWETIIESVGFKLILEIKTSLAIGMSLLANIVFALLAMIFIR